MKDEQFDIKAKIEKQERYANDRCTVEDLYRELMPGWSSLEEWFMWPPDVFLLTSILFKRTGCYRLVLKDIYANYTSPRDGDNFNNLSWDDQLHLCARSWLKDTNSKILQEQTKDRSHQPSSQEFDKEGRAFLKKLIREVEALCEKVTISELKVMQPGSLAAELCKKLLQVHAIADYSCAGFGLLNGSSSINKNTTLVAYLANLLLVGRGSLSGVPKFHGVVIPKMRTPQSGISPRSLSLHLSYHSTEVEVVWRVIPWTNIDENTLNILTVPWPLEINERCFGSTPDSFQPVRYFTYQQGEDTNCNLEGIVEMVCKLDLEIGRVHIIAFPELALSEEDYELLMGLLSKARKGKFPIRKSVHGAEDNAQALNSPKLSHVPIIISGIRNQKSSAGSNEMRMAAYFADKWYDLTQSKHHRWKLDRNQIRQYSLEGRLSTTRNWYEDMEVCQRRLTFLVPNGWLSICPLICEDLAQLEPVSELIRGVGPTFLMALLMDGPQLKERWPARYASVFADDPGTAVLTLTSIGMINRSVSLQIDKNTQTPSRNIALWKDQIKGWHTVSLEKSNRTFCLGKNQKEVSTTLYPNATMLTITADWQEELTADGRSDGGCAAAFKMEGDRPVYIENLIDRKHASPVEENKPDFKGGWPDIRELSALTFALDALLSGEGYHFDIIKSWVSFPPAQPDDKQAQHGNRNNSVRNYGQLISLMRESLINPQNCGISSENENWPSPSMDMALKEIENWKDCFLKKEDSTTYQYWQNLFDRAKSMLDQKGMSDYENQQQSEKEQKRVNRAIPIAILSSLHDRIERLRGPAYKSWLLHAIGASPEEAKGLLEKIEKAIEEYA